MRVSASLPYDRKIQPEDNSHYAIMRFVGVARRKTGLSHPENMLTDRSKAVLLLWIICVICDLCLSCFRVCSLLRCGHLKRKG